LIDIKTFWHTFLRFHGEKRETVHKNCSYFKVTITLIQTLYYFERLLMEYMQTHVYYNPYMGTRTRTRVILNPALQRV